MASSAISGLSQVTPGVAGTDRAVA
jgi:hypothetical protein